MWEAADRAIMEMNRANLRAFGRLKTSKWDEMHIIREVTEVYRASVQLARRKYREVYEQAYYEFLLEYGLIAQAAKAKASGVSEGWIDSFLKDADPTVLYAFLPEADRKKERLIEALAVALNKPHEIDKALRYWTFQVGQFTDNSLIQGRMQAMRDAGVEYVMWHTQEDERVCEDCEPLDGQIFPINAMPMLPQHPRCRCWVTAV